MKRTIQNNFFLLKKVWSIVPMYIVTTVLMQLLSSILSVSNIYLVMIVLNAIYDSSSFSRIVLIIIILGLLSLFANVIETSISNIYIPQYKQRLYENMQLEIYKTTCEVDLKQYDNPDFFDKYTLAMQQADSRAVSVVETFGAFISLVFSIIALSTLIVSLQPLLIAISCGTAVVSTIISFKQVKIQLQFVETVTPINRRMGYFQRVFYLSDYAKELRIYNPEALFREQFMTTNDELISAQTKKGEILRKYQSLSSLISNVAYCGIMLWNAFYVAHGLLLVGDFTALLNGSQMLNRNIVSIFKAFQSVYENSLYIEKYKDFLGYTKVKNGTVKIGSQSIAINLEAVSFSYHDSCQFALSDITVQIKEGQKVAVIGPNGSGKSTLVKLIAGLYAPDSGNILINGHHLSEYDLTSYRASIGYVFQECKLFAISIIENILMRPIEDRQTDEQLAWEALYHVGLADKIAMLPEGIYTEISKEFSAKGNIFSGGEQQRIAIARAYARKSKLVIFDEPTNGLDKHAEQQMINLLLSLPHNPTIIIISHNLDSLPFVDNVIALENGHLSTPDRYCR